MPPLLLHWLSPLKFPGCHVERSVARRCWLAAPLIPCCLLERFPWLLRTCMLPICLRAN
jgi:hypothetical protein